MSPLCSLTSNFDRDRQWGYCAPEKTQPVVVHTSRRLTDPCRGSPCQNGGVCTPTPHRGGFECSCPESFTGTVCEQKKCYETLHLRYYDPGESWGRIHLRNVEQCSCEAGGAECQRVPYTTCRTNLCQNDGTCRLITATGREVCNCRRGYSGPHCGFEPESECYRGRGADYRGLVGATLSGASCLAWNSDLLYNELHVGTVVAPPLRGLGEHAYCRNPDKDKRPWCYTLSDSVIAWEYCDIPPCVMPVSSARRVMPFNVLPGIKRPKPSTPRKKSVCGRKHKKRISIARGRIIGGNSALPGTHPWMAAIYIGQSSFCAGTMVSSCWIVSAAHCFFRKYVADILLVKLAKLDGRCARRTPFIRPICLPEPSAAFPDDYCCSISGWGHKHEKAEGYSSLQEAGVRLIPQEACRKPDVYGNHVTADMVCAGLNNCVDACQGDSGGPLACARDDVSFLYGIISWGDGCGRTKKPGVYTRVLNYMDWINSVIRRKPKAS
ncbi:Hepatocyte growth factor activator [Liparis tanakae]|uniref:trypsin n=1 Tax=Liparis tanakae TaxID=230148 RepID=A0A4Z2HPU7_9TELE|nr:Hepatocyte growth factor activator [Liparis tanakae]